MPFSAPGHSRCEGFRGRGEAEQAFADDVALDLARATGNLHARGVQEAIGLGVGQHGLGSSKRRRRVLTRSLEERHECAAISDQVGQRVAGDGAGRRQGPQAVETVPEADDSGGADRTALVTQDLHGHTPALVLRSEKGVGRHGHVVEEDFAELGVAGHLVQRPNVDAGKRHVEQEERDALVAREVGVSSGHEDAELGELSVGRPDLLTVDQIAIAVPLGSGLQAGEV